MRAALAVALALLATPASADWKYARWGMTGPQIIAASKGAAMTPPAGDAFVCAYTGQRMLAVAPNQEIAGMPFDVTFCATGTSAGLGSILLIPKGTDNAHTIKLALVTQYGEPVTSGRDGMTWRDTKARNTIRYSDLGGIVPRVDYSPIGGTGF